MALTHSIYSSITEVPEHEWSLLTADDADLTMDPRLIRAYEATMGSHCQSFIVVIRDEAGGAIGAACLCLFHVDVGKFPWLEKLVTTTRKFWRNCMKIAVLFCGLPVPAGQNHLRISPGADRTAVLIQLDLAMRQLARVHRAAAVVVKEFLNCECDHLTTLIDRGYLRGQMPARHLLIGEFGNFQNYLCALKARYRSQVNRSLKKLKKMGLSVEQVRGPVDFARVYTDEVHQLYEAVHERSDYQLERYPAEFMRELGRQFGEDVSLTCIHHEKKLVAFTIGLARNSIYHNLYSGVDYNLRSQGDLYFNLFYHDLDFAWQRGAREVHLGQTADDFKSRLGSTSEPVYLFIRPLNPVVRLGFKFFMKSILPKTEALDGYRIFKEVSQTT